MANREMVGYEQSVLGNGDDYIFQMWGSLSPPVSLTTLYKDAASSIPSVISPCLCLYMLIIYNYLVSLSPPPFLSLSLNKSYEDFDLLNALSTVPRTGSGILWLLNLLY